MESATFTFSGTTSTLKTEYNPSIELSPEKNYAVGLANLFTTNSIANIDPDQNKFYIGDNTVVFPTGAYELGEVESFIQSSLQQAGANTLVSISPNDNTLRSEIKSTAQIDFRPKDSIANLLGFHHRILPPNNKHVSDFHVNILKVNSIRVECSIATGAYINNQKVHTIHEFFPDVGTGFKIIETPKQIIYLPISTKSIDQIELRIVDQNGDLVDFRGEVITIRLHIKAT